MTHEESNQRTKEMLSASLKRFMAKKTLSKITVSEIITDCNVNRKTFYYHFTDIYDLLKWTLEQETAEVLKHFNLMIDYEDALRYVLRYVKNNAHILSCAFDSVGREQLHSFLHKDFYDITMNLIADCEEKYHIDLCESDRRFICLFLLEGMAGMLVNAIREKDACDEETTIRNVCAFAKTLPEILLRISENENR